MSGHISMRSIRRFGLHSGTLGTKPCASRKGSGVPKPIVVIPTVSKRSTYCKQTAYQWHNLGYNTVIYRQSDNMPCSPKQHGISSLAALRKAYNKYPLIFCEDDVLIDKRIACVQIPEGVHALTFYL